MYPLNQVFIGPKYIGIRDILYLGIHKSNSDPENSFIIRKINKKYVDIQFYQKVITSIKDAFRLKNVIPI